jgi:N,N'-diacetyllegionaminate synthase
LRHPILQNEGRVFVIGEAGVNHNGDPGLAAELIDAALEAGVDAVKFQTWQPGECTGRFAFKVDYLATEDDAESRYELSNRLALPHGVFRKLKDHCRRKGILFLSTPDGFQSLDFLVDELDMPVIKIGSTEVTHLQYIEAIARKRRPILLSTGMSTLGEVERCIRIIRDHNEADLVLMQCTSEYPAPDDEINLHAMVTMQEAFGLPVGHSDHSVGPEASVAAVALGARVVEKHFTLDKSLPGPDHKASMDPAELAELVRSIRRTEAMLGDGRKAPTASEQRNLAGIRRGVVAARDLSKGTRLTEDMLVAKRPFAGVEPFEFGTMSGMVLNRAVREDEPIRWDDVR